MRINSPYILKILPDLVGNHQAYFRLSYQDPFRGSMPAIEFSKPYKLLEARPNIATALTGLRTKVEMVKT